jgi:hypothetical protein
MVRVVLVLYEPALTASRTILAIILLILGIMIYLAHRGVTALAGELGAIATGVDRIAGKLDTISSKMEPIHLQTAIGWIGKPHLPPVRHFAKKPPPTVIDAICRP